MRKTWTRSVLAVMTATALGAGITVASAQHPGHSGGGGPHGGGPHGGGFAGPHGGGFAGPHGGGFAGPHGGGPHGGGFAGPHGFAAPHGGPGYGGQHPMHSEHFAPQGHGMQAGPLHSQRGLHGQVPHGNAHGFAQAGSHGHIGLSHEKMNRIHNVALHQGFVSRYRVHDVDFHVAVGAFVPRHFHHFFRVPEAIVFIEPAFADDYCFVYEDELVIVDPYTLEIIAIIPV
jgi:Protein of unknown function (DUF1236)